MASIINLYTGMEVQNFDKFVYFEQANKSCRITLHYVLTTMHYVKECCSRPWAPFLQLLCQNVWIALIDARTDILVVSQCCGNTSDSAVVLKQIFLI